MSPALPILRAHTVRPLDLAHPLPCGNRFVSAASGLAIVDGHFIVAVDDAHHLGVFPCRSTAPGRSVRIVAGDLPHSPPTRKRMKPDFEAVTLIAPTSTFPSGALLALGSGSTPNREVAIIIEIDTAGRLTERVHRRSLNGLYRLLREKVGEINIEGAFVLGQDLVLLSRANGSSPDNQVVRYSLGDLGAWLSGADSAPRPRTVLPLRVGDFDGVPLGITDGAALPGGGWVFSAAAEDTADSYNDGAIAGVAVGVMNEGDALTYLARLEPKVKVEGIVATVDDATMTVTMVTDGDDPTSAALLLVATLPI